MQFEVEWSLLGLDDDSVKLRVVNIVQSKVGLVVDFLHIEFLAPLNLVGSLTSVWPVVRLLVTFVVVSLFATVLLGFHRF